MTPEQLRTVGETLYGTGWVSKMARSLIRANGKPMSRRTVGRWAAGKYPIPLGVAEILRQREKELMR